MTFGLVRDFSDTSHLSFDNLQELEKSILSDEDVKAIVRPSAWVNTIAPIWKLWRTTGRKMGFRGPFSLPVKSSHPIRFSVLMGPSARRCADYVFAGRKAAFLIDATHPWTTPENAARFLDEVGISDVFVTHPDFVEPIQQHTTRCRVHFLPEAVMPSDYRPRAIHEKTIDLLEFGRKMPGFHQQLAEGLKATHYNHHFEHLETREEFVEALGRAKVITSFPRFMTHGDTETDMLSTRYFQCMASKALIVGRTPKLLKKLIGYDPVITADLDNPVEQMIDILIHYDRYLPLVEKNYKTLIDSHTYKHRWLAAKQKLLMSS